MSFLGLRWGRKSLAGGLLAGETSPPEESPGISFCLLVLRIILIGFLGSGKSLAGESSAVESSAGESSVEDPSSAGEALPGDSAAGLDSLGALSLLPFVLRIILIGLRGNGRSAIGSSAEEPSIASSIVYLARSVLSMIFIRLRSDVESLAGKSFGVALIGLVLRMLFLRLGCSASVLTGDAFLGASLLLLLLRMTLIGLRGGGAMSPAGKSLGGGLVVVLPESGVPVAGMLCMWVVESDYLNPVDVVYLAGRDEIVLCLVCCVFASKLELF